MQKLSTEELQSLISILDVAHQRIATRRSEFVCVAILKSGQGNAKQRDYLCAWIHSLLDGHYTLESWLTSERADLHSVQDRDKLKKSARLIKMAWIKWMIDTLKKELA